MNSSQASRVAALDKRYVWHPFTQMAEWRRDDILVIERADGNYLIDTRGRRYLDGVSSLWCNVHGHRVPELDRALSVQVSKIAHSTFLGLSHPGAAELAKRLVELAPKGLTKVFYSDSGSAAVEVALKMAYQYWQQKGFRAKRSFLKLENAYHGDTLGSVSVGGIQLFHTIFGPLLFKTYKAPSPYAYRENWKGTEAAYAVHCAERVEKILKRNHRRIAALVVEPLMQGAAGMLKAPKGFLRRLREMTRRYGVLLIVDEVATGFGRTGKMFACEHEKVSPDFLCVAKNLTGGYLPLSATLTTNRIYGAFLGKYADFKAFYHGHTYSANPLACAVSLANLDLFRKKNIIRSLQPKIRLLEWELEQIRRCEHVGDVRQTGLMVGIELVKDRRSKKPYPLSEKRGFKVCLAVRKRGILLRPLGNVVILMPPLSITESEIRHLCRAVKWGIDTVTR